MKKGNKGSAYYTTCVLRNNSAYNIFCEKYGKIINQKDYETIVYKIQKEYAKNIVSSKDGVELPNGIGDVKVVGIVPKVPAMDYKNSKLYKKPIFLTNSHTLGVKYRFIWIYKYSNKKFKKIVRFKNQELYIFKSNKYLKKLLKDSIFNAISNKDQPHFAVVDSSKNYNSL